MVVGAVGGEWSFETRRATPRDRQPTMAGKFLRSTFGRSTDALNRCITGGRSLTQLLTLAGWMLLHVLFLTAFAALAGLFVLVGLDVESMLFYCVACGLWRCCAV